MSETINLLRKLKALADRGIEGEKDAAQKMLLKMCQKHGITIEEIDGEKIYRKRFKVSEKDQKLFNQIVAHVCGGQQQMYGRRTDIFFDMTDSQYLETLCKFDFYNKELKKEYDIFYSAFVMRNELYPESSEKRSVDNLSDEDREAWYRANEMAQSIKFSHFNKQITA